MISMSITGRASAHQIVEWECLAVEPGGLKEVQCCSRQSDSVLTLVSVGFLFSDGFGLGMYVGDCPTTSAVSAERIARMVATFMRQASRSARSSIVSSPRAYADERPSCRDCFS